MKHSFVLILFVFISLQAKAQREYLATPEDLEHLNSTTTYVVLNSNPLSDYNLEIRDAVENHWSLTNYEFLDYDDFQDKSLDPGASFLYAAVVDFEKDKSSTRYWFLCLSLGDPERESLDELRDIVNIPLSYYGVDEDEYSYKLGTLIRFMENHVRLLQSDPALVSQNVFQHYNENMGDLRNKTLYLVEDEIESSIASEARLSQVYEYEFRIVDRETIKELIMNGDENAVFLHKVGPQNRRENARIYKVLIGAADARFYYYNYHKMGKKKPDAFLENDFRRISKAYR